MEIADCGCPVPPNSEGTMGWHLRKNHYAETLESIASQLKDLVQQIDQLREDQLADSGMFTYMPTVEELEHGLVAPDDIPF